MSNGLFSLSALTNSLRKISRAPCGSLLASDSSLGKRQWFCKYCTDLALSGLATAVCFSRQNRLQASSHRVCLHRLRGIFGWGGWVKEMENVLPRSPYVSCVGACLQAIVLWVAANGFANVALIWLGAGWRLLCVFLGRIACKQAPTGVLT